MQTYHTGSCLEDLLADDVIQAVMAADGVSADAIRRLFRGPGPGGGPAGGPPGSRQSNRLLTELSSEMRCIASARIGAMVN